MNAQRWTAVGLFMLIIACIATSGLWLSPFLESDEEEETPTPTPEESTEDSEEDNAEDTSNLPDAEPTINPIIADLQESLQMDEMGVGDEPFIIMAGDFTTIDSLHRGEGTASVYRIGEQQNVLRLDPFTVTLGPDLHVILSEHPSPRTAAEALLPTYVDLGRLKNIDGAQNYEIALGTNLDRYQSVVIFSLSLNIVYSSAPLEAVRGGS